MANAKQKQECPECHKLISGGPYFYQHMRSAHGIYGGRTGTKRVPKNGYKASPNVDVKAELKPFPGSPKDKARFTGFRTMDEFKVLEAADGTIWLAERIR
jgi:hypothetical protein